MARMTALGARRAIDTLLSSPTAAVDGRHRLRAGAELRVSVASGDLGNWHQPFEGGTRGRNRCRNAVWRLRGESIRDDASAATELAVGPAVVSTRGPEGPSPAATSPAREPIVETVAEPPMGETLPQLATSVD